MAELAGQFALFDTQSFPTIFDAEAYEVAYCPAHKGETMYNPYLAEATALLTEAA